MPPSLRVSKAAVRRFLLDKQQLPLRKEPIRAAKPDDVLGMIRTLQCVQIDPVAAVERNQHLVLGARMPKYKPAALEQLLRSRRVFEYWANAVCVIPMEDYPLFEAVRRHREQRLAGELDGLGSVVEHVLKRLESEGPLPSKAFESKDKVHGYWDNTNPKTKATSHVLNVLNDMGRILVVHREGTTRFFDIRERAVPADLLNEARAMSDTESKAALVDKYIRAYRLVDASDGRFGWQRMTAADRRQAVYRRIEQGTLLPLEIEGVKRPYFILAEDEDALMAHVSALDAPISPPLNQVRFLPPLDNLLWRRDRIQDLFDFTYTWEVYIPASKRQFGYYTMPILVGDELIGRIDPRLDRDNHQLNIELLQIEPGIRWTKRLQNRVFRALEVFARFHQADLGRIERTDPNGLMTT